MSAGLVSHPSLDGCSGRAGCDFNAANLPITAAQKIDRLTSEAASACLCGVAPVPVSSGKTKELRLHRGGDRQANRALYMITTYRLKTTRRPSPTWNAALRALVRVNTAHHSLLSVLQIKRCTCHGCPVSSCQRMPEPGRVDTTVMRLKLSGKVLCQKGRHPMRRTIHRPRGLRYLHVSR